MKTGIHPTYFEQAVITCSCGASLHTGSTVEQMSIEICSQCHPLYTGKKKLIDSTGRVERFKKLTEKSSARKKTLFAHKKSSEKKLSTRTATKTKKAATSA